MTPGAGSRVPISGARVAVLTGQVTSRGYLSTGADESEPQGTSGTTHGVLHRRRVHTGSVMCGRVYPGWSGCQGQCKWRAGPGGRRVHIRSTCKTRLGQGRCQNSARDSAGTVPEQCKNSAGTPDTRHPPSDTRHPTSGTHTP